MKKTLVVDTISLFFTLLFVYAAVCRLLHHGLFYFHLRQFPLIGRAAGIFAWILPFSELAIATLLLSVRWRFTGLFAAFCLLLFSTWFVAISIFFSSYNPCACAGILSAMTCNQYLVFYGICVVLASAAVLLYRPSLLVTQYEDNAQNIKAG